ncbi:MAG: cell division protein SepF [Thermoplasmatota archaeon]
MHRMGLVKRFFGESTDKRAANDYIDLSEYQTSGESGPAAATGASTYIRVAEIHKYDDLKEFGGYVYDGNILIIDFKPIAGDEIMLKRVTNDLRKLASDVGGDIAGLGDSSIILTPAGVKVDRRKLRAAAP